VPDRLASFNPSLESRRAGSITFSLLAATLIPAKREQQFQCL